MSWRFLLLSKSFSHQITRTTYESDLYQHFSALLSTDTNKITVSKENFRELVTIQRRYPRCELKIVPRLEPVSINTSNQKLPAPFSDPPQTEEVDELQETEGNDEILKGAADVAGEPKRTPKTPKKPKQSAKLVASSAPPQSQSPIESPQGKLKRAGSRSIGTLPKLCNPTEVAIVHRDHLPLLNNCFLPLLQDISGEQFFHRVVQHCSADRGKNCVLVSRPFKSTTLKVDGSALVVRQVSTPFASVCVGSANTVLMTCPTFFFPLLSWVLLLLDLCWKTGSGLIGCIPSSKILSGNATQNFIHSLTTSPVSLLL